MAVNKATGILTKKAIKQEIEHEVICDTEQSQELTVDGTEYIDRDTGLYNFEGLFADEFRVLAKHFMLEFFSKQELHCGGPIPVEDLITPENINLVAHTSFDDGIALIHAIFKCKTSEPDDYAIRELWEVHACLKRINRVKKFGVPKAFQPGIVLLYMKYCDGLPIDMVIDETEEFEDVIEDEPFIDEFNDRYTSKTLS